MFPWIRTSVVLGGAAWLAGAALPSMAQPTDPVGSSQVASVQVPVAPEASPAPADATVVPAVNLTKRRALPVAHVSADQSRLGTDQSGLAVFLMLNQFGPLPYAQR